MKPTEIAAVIDRSVRQVPDWPEPGVTFRDITPLLADPGALHEVQEALADAARAFGPVDAVLGVEARGFLLGPAIALALGAGFVPVRKEGKLPGATIAETYQLEYGTATIEIHDDALSAGQRVIVVDDVLATGGTMAATARLVEQAGARVVGDLVLIELLALGGRAALQPTPVSALRTY